MAKICVVMPYYKRQYQLNKTLMSLTESQHQDFSVIIIDDGSPVDIVLPKLSYEVEVIKLTNKTWTNCAPVYNTGFNRALSKGANIIIIQSSECYHVGDVLTYAEQNLTNSNYIAFGCFQIDIDTTFSKHDIIKLSQTNAFKVDGDNKGKGVNAWWNHPVYNIVPQYWGAAITSENLIKINGIDERFAYGYAYEDGWFIYQVKNLGLKIEITDYPFVVHQWHNREYPKNTPELLKINLSLYESLIKTNEYRSQHFITPDLQWSGT